MCFLKKIIALSIFSLQLAILLFHFTSAKPFSDVCPKGPTGSLCRTCQYNTTGNFCERCADGFYGNATHGSTEDCKACPCPLTISSNQFSPTCFLDSDGQPTCDACPPGYVGRNCEVCDSLYQGNPTQPGNKCKFKQIQVEKPKIQRVIVGTTATLICSITSNVTYTLVWTKEGASLPVQATEASGVLTIPNVGLEDAGTYVCTGSDLITVVQDRATLIVIGTGRSTPPRIVIKPHYQEVKVGDPVEFRCIAEGFPAPQIRWTGGRNEQINPQATFVGGLFRIPSARKSDEAEYYCTATNPAGSESERTLLLVRGEDTSKKEEPQLTISPWSIEAQRAETVRFECRVTGSPTPSITWSFSGGALPADSSQSGGVLTLPRITENHQGVYVCTASNIHGTAQAQARLIFRSRRSPPTAEVEPERQTIVQGTSGEIRCITNEVDFSKISWSKVGADLSNRHKIKDGNLLISDVTVEDRGLYVCRVEYRDGTAQASAIIEVVNENTRSRIGVKIKLEPKVQKVPVGTNVTFRCSVLNNVESNEPGTWFKSGGNFPEQAVVSNGILSIPNVRPEDGGSYTCYITLMKDYAQDTATLLVEGIVPFFGITPRSYMKMPTLSDAYLNFEVTISFKPKYRNGLILYNGEKKKEGGFLSLILNDGYVEFRFDLSSGVAVIRSENLITLDKWHTVQLNRTLRRGTLKVDDEPEVILVSHGSFVGRDLFENMYIGGVPDFNAIPKSAGTRQGFFGCISFFKTGNIIHNLTKEAEAFGISSCTTCKRGSCLHDGVCQETLSYTGYNCICPPGFSGRTCERVEESCYPGSCGDGRCVNRPEGGFDCHCPFGRTGLRCESDITIFKPALSDDAYIAYPTPKALRTLKLNMKLKPRTTDDCLIFYCAQSDDGTDDFISLAIKNKSIEFRYDLGSGLAIIQSEGTIQANEWLSIVAKRDKRKGSLIINNGIEFEGKSPGRACRLNLNTPFYIGSVDKHKINVSPSVGVEHGFDGCVAHIEINDVRIDLLDSVIDSSNVDNCDDRKPCEINPCLNGGRCTEDDSTVRDYMCDCSNGYSGVTCEIEDICYLYDPCKNGGTCIGADSSYKCVCPLGYINHHCEDTLFSERIELQGDGYLSFDRDLLPHSSKVEEIISFNFRSSDSEGLIFYHGQKPETYGKGWDYLAVAIVDGYLEFNYELGSGKAIIKSPFKVNDGISHSVTLNRTNRYGSLEVDKQYPQFSKSPGILEMLNTEGDIFIGGVPNHQFMTAGKYPYGFVGCLWDMRIQNSGPMNFFESAKSSANVQPCEEDINLLENLMTS